MTSNNTIYLYGRIIEIIDRYFVDGDSSGFSGFSGAGLLSNDDNLKFVLKGIKNINFQTLHNLENSLTECLMNYVKNKTLNFKNDFIRLLKTYIELKVYNLRVGFVKIMNKKEMVQKEFNYKYDVNKKFEVPYFED